ncbi:MAG: alpha/beta fold hydrolase [Gaiella sp.]
MPAALPPAVPIVCPAEARALGPVRCGFVRVPLDRSAVARGRTIRVYFELYRRRDTARPAESTVVSVEGGPGYGTTPGRASRVALWRPLSLRRNLLLVDLRGTGRSGALRCRALARSTRGYWQRAGRCARELGAARDLYGTGDAVDDVEDVLTAIRARRIDLYGDSYGTYAAQAFALRHPGRLRTLTLDAAYPLPGTDPAYADLAGALRRGLRLTCRRSPGCPAAERREDAVALVGRLARLVRRSAVVGVAPDGDGNRRRMRVDETVLAQVAGSSYYSYPVWRDLLAAAEAALRGDTAPLLRLAAEHVIDDVGIAQPALFSDPTYLAVTCHDYPQLWEPETRVGDRVEEVRARLASYPPGTFAPFSAAAWTGGSYEGPLSCIEWPSPAAGQPPQHEGAAYPDVPTLVLNGDLDTITSSAGARVVASRFSNSRFVEVANSVHVTALGDRDGCASRIYWRFVKARRVRDTSCARRVAPLRLVPRFAGSVGDVDPGRPEKGNDASAAHRRIAVAASRTAADVVSRWWLNYDGTGVGLRGGSWTYEGDDPVLFTLDRVELVPAVEVSGSVRWERDGTVAATLDVHAPRGERALFEARWSLARRGSRATLSGWVAGERLLATMRAP